jgi:L-cysteine S-thiosulfotransferase
MLGAAAMLRALALFMLTLGVIASVRADDVPQSLAEGQKLAHDVMKGNCLACHMMPGDAKAVTSATIGPPLIGMKPRFPDRDKLRAQIWDATKANPETVMPPYGRHKILTEGEIDKIVDYLLFL